MILGALFLSSNPIFPISACNLVAISFFCWLYVFVMEENNFSLVNFFDFFLLRKLNVVGKISFTMTFVRSLLFLP